MRTTFMTMAAIAALSVAAPVAAQPRDGHRTDSGELQMQIDAGFRSGSISANEVTPLRDGLRQLVQLEQRFSRNGISGREHAVLQQHGNALRQQISLAERTGYDRSSRDRTAWNDRYDREHRADWESRYARDRDAAWDSRDSRGERFGSGTRFDRPNRGDRFASDARFDRPNRGDRFAGDARIGQHTSMRMRTLPREYREEFRDDENVYYRYDDRRIYQIDRRTDLILGLLDVGN